MVNYVNEKVYREASKVCNTTQDEVRRIYDFIGQQMNQMIIQDNPNVSLKLDYIGNLYSHPYRREIVLKKKENGQSTNDKG